MGMNWGGFAGGFSQGFNNGMNMGKQIREAFKQKEIEDARAEGIVRARAAQEQAIASSIRENGIETATPATEATTAPAPVASPAPAAPSAPNAYPLAEDPLTADRGAPPVDSSLAGAPASPAVEPTATASVTRAAAPAPAEPKEVVAPAKQEPAPAAPVAASGIATPKKRFEVAGTGKSFDTREEALEYARSNGPSVMDFAAKTLVPKMQEAYLAQGDIEKAEAWGKWAKERDNQKNMETWGKAYRAAQAGNWEKAAEHFVQLHNNFDDGLTVVGKPEVSKDENGNITGFNIKIKNDASGEVRSQFIDRNALVETGLAALSPPALFEQTYKRKAEADLLGAKARIDAQNDARTYRREMDKQTIIENRADKRAEAADRRAAAKAEREHDFKLEELATKDELERAGYGVKKQSELQAEMDFARKNGFSDDEIKTMVMHKIGGGFKKTTDPTERRAIVTSELLKSDPSFAHEKDPAKQNEKVDRMMSLIYGPGSGTTGKAAPSATTPGAAAPAKKGTPYLTPDGRVIYR